MNKIIVPKKTPIVDCQLLMALRESCDLRLTENHKMASRVYQSNVCFTQMDRLLERIR